MIEMQSKRWANAERNMQRIAKMLNMVAKYTQPMKRPKPSDEKWVVTGRWML